MEQAQPYVALRSGSNFFEEAKLPLPASQLNRPEESEFLKLRESFVEEGQRQGQAVIQNAIMGKRKQGHPACILNDDRSKLTALANLILCTFSEIFQFTSLDAFLSAAVLTINPKLRH